MPEQGASVAADVAVLSDIIAKLDETPVKELIDYPALLKPIKVRDIEFPNRLGVPPMCNFACDESGAMNHIHLVQYASYIMGGVGMVVIEAAAVEPEGRLSNHCIGLYNDKNYVMLKQLVDIAHSTQTGCKIGVQIAHGGRKAGADMHRGLIDPPGLEGWNRCSPTDSQYGNYGPTKTMTIEDMNRVKCAFVRATEKLMEVGMDFVEIHAAHGYLLHEFLSPITNRRSDEYGGSNFENRIKFPLEVCRAVRAAVPKEKPVVIRLSASDLCPHLPEQWDVPDFVKFCQILEDEDIVQMFDVSAGGLSPEQQLPLLLEGVPGYQLHFAETLRKGLKKSSSVVLAVGGFTEPVFANEAVTSGKTDMILVGREALRNPRFGLNWSMDLHGPVKPEKHIAAGYMMSARKKALLAKMTDQSA